MDWKSILVTAIVTVGATAVSGMFLFWLQAKESKLVYSSILSEPFVEEDYRRYIQQIDVSNSGDTFLERINFSILFSNAEISNHNIKIDPTIRHRKEVSDNFLKIFISDLNEGESVRISLILISTASELVEPEIHLRASNVNGQLADRGTTDKVVPIAIAAVSAYIGLIAALLSTRLGRRAIRMTSEIIPFVPFSREKMDFLGRDMDEIASALAISGLADRAREVVTSPNSRRYSVESDLLTAEAISSDDEEMRQKILSALHILSKKCDAAPSDRAIVMCNIAKILEFSGFTDEALEVLYRGREISKRAVSERVEVDPVLERLLSELN